VSPASCARYGTFVSQTRALGLHLKINLTSIEHVKTNIFLLSVAEVLIYFKIAPVNESVSFESSSYNFTIKENEPEASTVGTVKALTGSPLVSVSYNMKTYEDIFSVDGEGTIKALRPLDKEEEEWYILTVQAIDSRTPANTAETTVLFLF